MTTVAAIVAKPGATPTLQEISLAEPTADEVRVRVVAVGYSHLVRLRASGAHYSDKKSCGARLVGVDGVGYVGAQAVYFVAFNPGQGSYCAQLNVSKRDTYVLPLENSDDESLCRVAALANGAMLAVNAFSRLSSVPSHPIVLILGASGTAGTLAVQIAKTVYGARRVIGCGRDVMRLQNQPLLDAIIPLNASDDELTSAGVLQVDIVLDYLWGLPAVRLVEFIARRQDASRLVQWVLIGSMLGEAEMPLSAQTLRSSNLVLLGSGLCSLDTVDARAALCKVVDMLARSQVSAPTRQVPIQAISAEWDRPWDSRSRLYFKF